MYYYYYVSSHSQVTHGSLGFIGNRCGKALPTIRAYRRSFKTTGSVAGNSRSPYRSGKTGDVGQPLAQYYTGEGQRQLSRLTNSLADWLLARPPTGRNG